MVMGGAYIRLSVALALMSVTLFMTSAYGQSPANAPAQVSQLGKPGNSFLVQKPRSVDLEAEVATVKADNAAIRNDNAAIREQLRTMEEQQSALLELVDQLQKRLGGPAVAEVARPVQPSNPVEAAEASLQLTTAVRVPWPALYATPLTQPSSPGAAVVSGPLTTTAKSQSVSPVQAIENRYRDGIIIWETPENTAVPFLLRLQGTTQVRYINSLSSQETFTDHLGVTYAVDKRNDITVNRSMMVFGGYIFNKRAPYSFTIWTSAGSASIVVAVATLAGNSARLSR